MKFPTVPTIETNNFIEKAKKEISINYKDYYGDDEKFNYPITTKDADDWLDKFSN